MHGDNRMRRRDFGAEVARASLGVQEVALPLAGLPQSQVALVPHLDDASALPNVYIGHLHAEQIDVELDGTVDVGYYDRKLRDAVIPCYL